MDTVDAELFTLCTEMNCTFVNNDNNFKTADGSANDCYLTADGLHLSRYGTNRLARNLKLHMKGQDATKDDRSHQTQDATNGDRPHRSQNQQQKQRQSTQRRRPNHRRSGDTQQPDDEQRDNANSQRDQRSKQCYNCGEASHHTDKCRLNYRLKCHSCGRLGHKSYMCKSR